VGLLVAVAGVAAGGFAAEAASNATFPGSLASRYPSMPCKMPCKKRMEHPGGVQGIDISVTQVGFTQVGFRVLTFLSPRWGSGY
jgi:hypothetical protein